MTRAQAVGLVVAVVAIAGLPALQSTGVIAATVLYRSPPPTSGLDQIPAQANPADQAGTTRVQRAAEQFEASARVLTVFDRQGRVVTTVGERAVYDAPVFSPDRTRLAVMTWDYANESRDLLVLDVATGNGTRITASRPMEGVLWFPVWSPDGSQVAYGALRGGKEGLYRKASNGEGAEELLYQRPGGGKTLSCSARALMTLRDWSFDGRFLSFSTLESSGGGTLYVLPLAGDGEREPVEVSHSASSDLWAPSFSPDGRYLSYSSDQSGRGELYVRPFAPSAAARATPVAGPWQVSDQGTMSHICGQATAFWRQDGKEIYYVDPSRGVMVVGVSTDPGFDFGKPTLLFRLPETVNNPWLQTSVSRDGQRVVALAKRMP